MKAAGLLVAILMVAGSAAAEEKELDPELKVLQGTWQRNVRTADGTMYRVLKIIEGTTESVTWLDESGKLRHSHSVDFEIRKDNDVRIFTYFNGQITNGPDAGKARPGRRSYIYRVEKDLFIEVQNMMVGDRGTPGLLLWKKADPKDSLGL